MYKSLLLLILLFSSCVKSDNCYTTNFHSLHNYEIAKLDFKRSDLSIDIQLDIDSLSEISKVRFSDFRYDEPYILVHNISITSRNSFIIKVYNESEFNHALKWFSFDYSSCSRF